MEDTDAQLHLKKRARRRLVGAVAFVMLVAVVLPMIMDHEPKQVVQDVEIRIPGQDEKPFAPKFAAAPQEKPAASAPAPAAPAKPAEAAKLAEPAPAPDPTMKPVERLAEKPVEKAIDKPVEKPADKTADKPAKPPEKPVAEKAAPEKAPTKAEKPIDKAGAKEGEGDAKRAAAILAGKPAEPAAKGGEHVVLIGAFANEANVKTIKSKLGELGIKVYTEPLDSPQGRKTRVRAGPFANREAAEKALDKMKRIGVAGVVAAKQ